MTEERLAEIKARATTSHFGTLHADRLELIAEVERLQAELRVQVACREDDGVAYRVAREKNIDRIARLQATIRDALSWATDRKEAETAHRPDANIHKRTLCQTWDQVIRYLEAIAHV